jgi:hypothetical protein
MVTSMSERASSFDEAVTELRRAIGGDLSGFAGELAAARARTGVPDAEIPAYLPRALAALARGPHDPEPIAPAEQGASWLLQDVAPILPGASLVDDAGRDGLAIASLGRALVITRGDERWSVVPWPAAAASERVLGTFDPSEAQIRAWAADPGLRFASQDEELAIEHPRWLELLIDLAGDRPVAKRDQILRVLDRIVALPRTGGVALMTRARDLARRRGGAALAAWADELDAVLAYGAGAGPVSLDGARAIARRILLGRSRPTLVLDETAEAGGWTFQARFPEDAGGQPLDRLHVDAATGALTWAARPSDPIATGPQRARLAALDPAL